MPDTIIHTHTDHSERVSTNYSREGLRTMGLGVWPYMFRNIIKSRAILLFLVRRDILVRYKQSFLGLIWVLIPPVVTAAIFGYIQSSRLLPIAETQLPYFLFALCNLAVWQPFSSILLNATSSLLNAGALVTKLNFPKDTLVFAAAGQPVLDFIIRSILICSVFAAYRILPNWESVFIPLLLLPVLLLALGIGFILSILNLAVRDASNALSLVLSFGVFFAPILYPAPTTHPFSLIVILNPISPVLMAIQDIITSGTLNHPDLYIMSVLVSGLVFFVGLRLFHLTIPRVAERA